MKKRRSISIIVCAYNEEENIDALYKELVTHMAQPDLDFYEIVWVNDGSNDKTLEKCKALAVADTRCKIVNLMRNFGKEVAMTAGMDHAKGRGILFMDADLQHPPHYLPQMIRLWQEGCDVVLTRRVENQDEGFFSRFLGLVFYKLLNLLSDIPIPSQSPDFRLIDHKYVVILKKLEEGSRMFRGLLNWTGLSNYTVIDFTAPKRFAGKTKYNLRKSLGLAVDSILQFSIRPLRIAMYLGLFTVCFISVIALYTLWDYFFHGVAENGYNTTIITIVFVSSVQLIFLGILGEYIGRIHLEVKKRPLYFAEYISKDLEDDASA